MMREILMESKLGDEKRLKEILSMLKTRLQTSFLSAGHTTAVLRSLSYTSPIARFRDITSGIGFYEVVKDLEENFEERKELLIENLKKIAGRIFRKENLMLSYTSAQEGLAVLEKAVPQFADSLHTGEKRATDSASSTVRREMRASELPPKSSMWQGPVTLLMVEQNIRVHCRF